MKEYIPVGPISQSGLALQVVDRADHAPGIAHYNRARRDILVHHGAGTDNRVSAYPHKWQDGHIDADLHPLFDMRPSHTLARLLAARMNVVCDGNARSHESIVLDNSELSDVAVAVDLDVVADLAAVVYGGAVPHVEVVTDLVLFAYGYVMAGGEAPCYDDLWQFDPILNQWIQKTNTPGGLRDDGAAFSIGNKGYFGLGQLNASTNASDFWEYTPDSCSSIPQPSVSLASSDTGFCEKQCINFFDLSSGL